MKEDELFERLDSIVEAKEDEWILFDPERLLKHSLNLKGKQSALDKLFSTFDKLYHKYFVSVPSANRRYDKVASLLVDYFNAWSGHPIYTKKARFLYMIEIEKLFDLKKVVYPGKGHDKVPKKKEKPRKKGRGHLDEQREK
jgi:hypothetical protein